LFNAELQTRALRAAGKAARRLGISDANPVILGRSRDIRVLLPDTAIVARVASATAETIAIGTRELRVTRYLGDKGAPVVAPSAMMPAEPLIVDGMAVTFWPHLVHETIADEDEAGVGAAAYALRRVQDALADYPEALPSFEEKLEDCAALLGRPSALPALADEDRTFLMRAYERLRAGLAPLPLRLAPIHGDAHLGNAFLTRAGPLWTDFEAVCRGPREWDAVCESIPAVLQPLDPQLLAILTELRRLCVIVWCSGPAADPGKRAAAEYHLARLKP
jgi:hypothetical protein